MTPPFLFIFFTPSARRATFCGIRQLIRQSTIVIITPHLPSYDDPKMAPLMIIGKNSKAVEGTLIEEYFEQPYTMSY